MVIPLFKSGKVYLCKTQQEWIDAHRALNAEVKLLDRVGASNSFKHLDGGMDIHLLGWFDQKPSTLAHESAHLIFDICHEIGIRVESGQANETFCYLLDSLVEFALMN